jgi:hypothetical protein
MRVRCVAAGSGDVSLLYTSQKPGPVMSSQKATRAISDSAGPAQALSQSMIPARLGPLPLIWKSMLPCCRSS